EVEVQVAYLQDRLRGGRRRLGGAHDAGTRSRTWMQAARRPSPAGHSRTSRVGHSATDTGGGGGSSPPPGGPGGAGGSPPRPWGLRREARSPMVGNASARARV